MQLADLLPIQNGLAIRYHMEDDSSPCKQTTVGLVSHSPDGSAEQLGTTKVRNSFIRLVKAS